MKQVGVLGIAAGIAGLAAALIVHVLKEVSKPPSGSAHKVLDARPPLTEREYRAKFGGFPPNGILIVPQERLYFQYVAGERLFWSEDRQVWWPGEP